MRSGPGQRQPSDPGKQGKLFENGVVKGLGDSAVFSIGTGISV